MWQRPLSVPPVVIQCWSVPDPESVYSACPGLRSSGAWYSTSLGLIPGRISDCHFHVFVSDVVKSFDTVDQDLGLCALKMGFALLVQTLRVQ